MHPKLGRWFTRQARRFGFGRSCRIAANAHLEIPFPNPCQTNFPKSPAPHRLHLPISTLLVRHRVPRFIRLSRSHTSKRNSTVYPATMAASPISAQPAQSVFPKSHVGFDSITNQIEKKLLKRGFQFNVICVGMSRSYSYSSSSAH